MIINPSNWKPAGDMELEKVALTAIEAQENTLVVAGPGAGKTELLAQKACYLLQTNLCPHPKRILAISFKRDAARNLKDRVRLRCEQNLERRFDSMTFDSFAKQLLDHFRNALTPPYDIIKDYTVVTAEKKKIDDEYRGADEQFFNTSSLKFERFHTAEKLPLPSREKAERIRSEVWQQFLHGKQPSLTFRMIMRLAQYLVATNPLIRQYLQQTYSHVFLDEFQDTTDLQYSLLQTCFEKSMAQFTAVGDDKQRIMIWAGALPEIFRTYTTDHSAKPLSLKMNFRSAPRLVALQNFLVRELLGKEAAATASSKWKANEGSACVWSFATQEQEAIELCKQAQELIDAGIAPRDICIIVKQQPNVTAKQVIGYFNSHAVPARNEDEWQDFITEEVIVYLVNMIYAVFDKGATAAREQSLSFLINLNNGMTDQQLLRLHGELIAFITAMRKKYAKGTDKGQMKELMECVLEFAGKGKIKHSQPQYRQGSFYNTLLERFLEAIADGIQQPGNILSTLDRITGKGTIPIMTIHKSKGLEYHTVIFVGLEDQAFWNFRKQPDEDFCAFFVALSRAKESVIFTFSKKRENQWGKMESRSQEAIKVIMDQLSKSGLVAAKVF